MQSAVEAGPSVKPAADAVRLPLRVLLAVSLGYMLLQAVHLYLDRMAMAGGAQRWWAPALVLSGGIACFAALTPAIQRSTLIIRSWSLHAAVAAHAAGAAMVTLACSAAVYVAHQLVAGPVAIGYWDVAASWFNEPVLLYLLVVLTTLIRDSHVRSRARQAEAARMRELLARSELALLREQLRPHFLFDTLNAISTMVREAPAGADAMISRLASLLRYTLQASSVHEVRLADELAMIAQYVALHGMRHPGVLQVETDVTTELQHALVPPFILQPLVENAIVHGFMPAQRTGSLRITAHRQGARLELRVEDDGVGLERSTRRSGGAGLSTVAARLHQLYGPGARVALSPRFGGGTICTLDLPWHTAPADALEPVLLSAS